MAINTLDLTGCEFGRLTVIRYVETRVAKSGRNNMWKCKCKCGGTRLVSTRDLRRGAVKSCGCLRKDIPNNTKHGKSKSRMYKIWIGIKQRTRGRKNNTKYNTTCKNVGMCDRWFDSFENFYADMHEGYADGLTIDRIDNSKGYEQGNCRWASMVTQANNKSNNIKITISGKTKTLPEWCRVYDVPYGTAYRRLKIYKWQIEDVFKPVIKRKA